MDFLRILACQLKCPLNICADWTIIVIKTTSVEMTVRHVKKIRESYKGKQLILLDCVHTFEDYQTVSFAFPFTSQREYFLLEVCGILPQSLQGTEALQHSLDL